MYYGNIEQYDVVNGPGVRTLLFVSGCTHQCKGCHNEESWNFTYGDVFGRKERDLILKHLSSPEVQGFSLLGGEPFESVIKCTILLRNIREAYPEKDIWVWSGYTYEQLTSRDSFREMLELCDVLVDGPYIDSQRDLSLNFRGSKNQRIIDVKRSLKEKDIVFNKYHY